MQECRDNTCGRYGADTEALMQIKTEYQKITNDTIFGYSYTILQNLYKFKLY